MSATVQYQRPVNFEDVLRQSKSPRDTSNRLLRMLSTDARARLLRDCEEVELGLKAMVYNPDKPITSVYFPQNGVISMVATTHEGKDVEVATTGNEGMVGLPLFLGVNRSPLKAFSQVPGSSLRLSAKLLKKNLENGSELPLLLQRFTQALMMQISQGTACNRAHNVEQRACRWLLMTHDRVSRQEFPLTQEFLAQMLGVRRPTVTEVASELQSEKLIRYTRGIINILNRRGLERRSCSCYWIIRTEYDRLLETDHRSNHHGRTPS